MKKDRMKVLVIGATGKQGGHVARLLLSKGHGVCAFTRKPDSPAARDLSEFGAQIITGDLTDRASLERAFEGVDAVFSMTTSIEAGVEAEIKQGFTVADAVKAQENTSSSLRSPRRTGTRASPTSTASGRSNTT